MPTFVVLMRYPDGELIAIPVQNILLVERSMDAYKEYYTTITVVGLDKIDVNEGFHHVMKLIGF